MQRFYRCAIALVTLLFGAATAYAQDASRVVAGGGISVAGWQGRIDAREAERGATLDAAKLAQEGNALHITTGPAVVYWNPSNRATGSYTVSATFNELQYMNLNDHPHPYGIFIGGNQLGTDNQSLLYCAAYGNGRFIVRGFGPEPFALNGRRPEENAAVNSAAGQGQPVTQQIAVTVHPDRVECSVNGTVVGSYPKSDVVQSGRLTSTDGIYGIRAAHNTEVVVSYLKVTQH